VPGLVRLPVGVSGKRSRRGSFALRLIIPVSVFVAWWVLTATKVIPPTTLSTPAVTWDAFVQLWRHDDLIGDIGVSVRRAAFGLALGASIGLILGIVVGLTRLGEELFDASMQMLRMVPYPAVIFLFIIWFGIGETAKVLLIGLATVFPMYLNTSSGVRNVDKRVVEAARSFGLQGGALVRKVIASQPASRSSRSSSPRASAPTRASVIWWPKPTASCRSTFSWSASSSTRCWASRPTLRSVCSSASPCRGDGTRRSDELLPPRRDRPGRRRPRREEVLRRAGRAE
jgi:ABC-type nitrate/sulfonate/bicarbonate transport system permease component